jgi:hypothetical protein
MALLTDDAVITLDDLLTFESSLAQVAASHGINVETKISLSITNVGNKLLMWLYSVGASDPQWLTRRSLGLSTIVITPTLHRWICFDALTRFFAEAYNVQLNTRFQGKWAEYQKEATEAAATFFMSGVGGVYNALSRPRLPLVSVQDGTAAAQAIFIQTAWVDSLGHESALSAVNGQVLSGAASIVVAMAEGAIAVPSSAAGWNVYASDTQTGLSLQCLAPLPIGSTWQLPATGLIAGGVPKDGQKPEYYVTLSRQIKRG